MTNTSNMVSNTSGNPVANQFIIKSNGCTYFQSYTTVIAKIGRKGTVTLNTKWDHSATTTKYLNQFLNTSNKKEIVSNVESKFYKVANLNKNK